MYCTGNTKTEVRIGKDSFVWPVCLDLDDCVVDLLELTQFDRRNWNLVSTDLYGFKELTFY